MSETDMQEEKISACFCCNKIHILQLVSEERNVFLYEHAICAI